MKRKDYLNDEDALMKMESYHQWKEHHLKESGYFPIFSDFKENDMLKNISGNALKLYIYLGLHSKNYTGESWHSIENMSKYFERSPRTISGWLEELKEIGLIDRIQPNRSSTAVTFLRPYEKENRE